MAKKAGLVTRVKVAFKGMADEAVRRSAAKAGKPTPARPVGRAGSYVAPVDTAGMDREMKRTLGVGRSGKKRGK